MLKIVFVKMRLCRKCGSQTEVILNVFKNLWTSGNVETGEETGEILLL